jgi:hypothetical protein
MEWKFFSQDEAGLQNSLSQMVQESYVESNCNLDETYRLTRQKLELDRRYDAMNKDRLVNAAREAGNSGAKIDWRDPWLYGGQKRPGR